MDLNTPQRIYVFTDASFMSRCCKNNKLKRNVGTVAVIFNKNKQKHKAISEVKNCISSEHAEINAINVALTELLFHFNVDELQSSSIIIHTDCMGAISKIKQLKPKKRSKINSLIKDEIEYICEFIKLWNLNVDIQYVGGHYKKKYKNFNVRHIFNIECDKIAKHAARKLMLKKVHDTSEYQLKYGLMCGRN